MFMQLPGREMKETTIVGGLICAWRDTDCDDLELGVIRDMRSLKLGGNLYVLLVMTEAIV